MEVQVQVEGAHLLAPKAGWCAPLAPLCTPKLRGAHPLAPPKIGGAAPLAPPKLGGAHPLAPPS